MILKRTGLICAAAALVLIPNCRADSVTYVPDPATTFTEWLRDAIDDAPGSGRDIYVPEGTYDLDGDVIIQSNDVRIHGGIVSGGVYQPAIDASGYPSAVIVVSTAWDLENDRAAIAASGVSGFLMENIKLRGPSLSLFDNSNKALYGIVFYGTTNCKLENVSVRNLGRTRGNPGGTNLVLIASESARSEVGSIEQALSEYAVLGQSCTFNEIVGCRFIDSTGAAADPAMALTPAGTGPRAIFGIRLYTNWKLKDGDGNQMEPDDYTQTVSDNDIKDCTFRGYFETGVEVGGPATIDNTVENNTFELSFEIGMESDKGARFNTFKYNTIEVVKCQKDIEDIETGVKTSVRVFAVRDQGYVNDEGFDRLARGNKFYRNTIETVIGRKQFDTAAFLLSNSHSVNLKENTVEEIVVTGNTVGKLAHTVIALTVKWAKFAAGDLNEVPTSTELAPYVDPDAVTNNNEGAEGFKHP